MGPKWASAAPSTRSSARYGAKDWLNEISPLVDATPSVPLIMPRAWVATVASTLSRTAPILSVGMTSGITHQPSTSR